MDFSREEVEEFFQEVIELFEEAEKSLLDLDNGGAFQQNYDAIFRSFHSAKGGAGMMEQTELQSHMHQLENLLVTCQENATIPKNYIDLFLRGIDGAKEIMSGKSIEFDFNPTSEEGVAVESKLEEVATQPSKNEDDQSFLGQIVVLDDELDLAEMLGELLRKEGFAVDIFSDPVLALDYIKTHTVDLVFSDFSMPKMDGEKMVKEIHGHDPGIPVVLISGFLKGDMVLPGVYAIFEKPFNHQMIVKEAIHAIRKCQSQRLLNRAVDVLIYQFSDLDDFLRSQGKEQIRKTIKQEIKSIIDIRKKIRELNQKATD